MNYDVDIKTLEENISEAKKTLELGKAVERLKTNRDFRTVILNGYLRDEAVRLVSLKASPEQETPSAQASIIRQIDSIGNLEGYLRILSQQANLAAKTLGDAEATREALLAEEE